jgi:hypothetical protein
MDELDTFRLVTGVFFASASRLGDSVMGAVATGGDMVCPNAPLREGRVFGVRATILLLVNSGRGLAVFCTFWVCESGNFLAVEPGWATEGVLLGVAAGVVTLALTLRRHSPKHTVAGVRSATVARHG